MHLHKGAVVSLKRNGSRFLSCSKDASTALWNGTSGNLVKQFKLHTAAVMDKDFRDRFTFVSHSAYKMIYLCDVDGSEHEPVQVYEGHTAEINCLQFSPTGTVLASGSDDCIVNIWKSDSHRATLDLKQYTNGVITLQWAPNYGKSLMLATASSDHSVKLWDINSGTSTRKLAGLQP